MTNIQIKRKNDGEPNKITIGFDITFGDGPEEAEQAMDKAIKMLAANMSADELRSVLTEFRDEFEAKMREIRAEVVQGV